MPNSYKDIIRGVQNGEPVDAATANNPTNQLDNNFRALKSRVELLEAGKSLHEFEQPCESNVLVGQPVYFNESNGRYERALAGVETINGHERLTPSTYVVGIVTMKHNDTLCDIVTLGMADVDISEAVVGDVEVGVYYLSNTTPGGLRPSPEGVGVPILQVLGPNKIFLRANLGDVFIKHIHLKRSLTCAPAGVPVLSGGFWDIEDADSAELGWLPADDPVFDSLAPAGAVFGYNLAADDLNQVWPPLPLSSAYLEWDRGDGRGGAGVNPDLCVIDENGIWWMSACEDDAPWQYGSGATTTTTESSACPVVGRMRMTLYLTKMVADTGSALVRALRSSSDLLKFVCTGTTDVATDGDLTAILDFALALDPTADDLGALAVKTLTTGGKLKRGPIATGVKSASASLLVTGSSTTVNGFARGNITLAAVSQPIGAELAVDDVQLKGVQLEYPADNVTLMFEADRDSSLVAKVNAPFGLDGLASIGVKVRAWVLGTTAGTLPLLTLIKRPLPRPDGSPVDLPDNTDDAAVTFNTAVAVGANQYVEVDSDSITMTPGSSLQIKISRDADDSYAGDVHLLKLVVVITSAVAEE